MQKSIGKNYIYNVIYQLLIIVIPLVTVPYVSRVLGVEGIGEYSYTYSIASYFVLFSVLGTSTYGQREIAFVRDNKKELSIKFYEILILRVCSTIICLCVYTICTIFLFDNKNIMFVQALNIVATMVDISWFFQGLEEFKKIVSINAFFKIINLIYIFIFIKQESDVLLYVAGMGVFTVLGNIVAWWSVKKYLLWIDFLKLQPLKNIKAVMELFVPTIAMQIYLVLDKTMIGIFAQNTIENGYYEQAEKIVKVSMTIVTSMGTVMIPRVSYLFKNSDLADVKENIYRSYRFAWFLGMPIFMGIIVLADMIVPWYLGDGYEKCTLLIRVFSLLILAVGINNVTGMQYLIPVGKQNIFTVTVSLGAVVNLILNFFLIPRLYSIGAALSSVIAESVIAILQIIYVVCGKEKFQLGKILYPAFKYVCVSLIMVLVLYLIKGFFYYNFICTFLMIIVGATLYFLLLFVLKDEFITIILKKARGVFVKK